MPFVPWRPQDISLQKKKWWRWWRKWTKNESDVNNTSIPQGVMQVFTSPLNCHTWLSILRTRCSIQLAIKKNDDSDDNMTSLPIYFKAPRCSPHRRLSHVYHVTTICQDLLWILPSKCSIWLAITGCPLRVFLFKRPKVSRRFLIFSWTSSLCFCIMTSFSFGRNINRHFKQKKISTEVQKNDNKPWLAFPFQVFFSWIHFQLLLICWLVFVF